MTFIYEQTRPPAPTSSPSPSPITSTSARVMRELLLLVLSSFLSAVWATPCDWTACAFHICPPSVGDVGQCICSNNSTILSINACIQDACAASAVTDVTTQMNARIGCCSTSPAHVSPFRYPATQSPCFCLVPEIANCRCMADESSEWHSGIFTIDGECTIGFVYGSYLEFIATADYECYGK